MHGAEHRTGEDAAAERSWTNEARRPTLTREWAHVGRHARVLWEATVIEAGWCGAVWSARGGVGDRVIAAHVGAVGKPDLVATLRMHGGDPGVGAINQELDGSKALACSRYGALLDAEAQGAEAALGTRGEVEEFGRRGEPRGEAGRDRREGGGDRYEGLAHGSILAEGRA